MRLLQLNGDGEFSLTEYVGKNIPPYAILSHTWGSDEEEVNFQDIIKGKGKSKLGYRKLTFCAKQAAHDNLPLFWVDTCCIDKSSSAELTEAINSMFQWYQRSDKCYVYLDDVSIVDPNQGNLSSQQTWKEAFGRSRWFTRGWTLQELLAPKSVEFYTIAGELLGDKVSLLQDIHDATGISIVALEGTPLPRLSVEERMSWAKRRDTERDEDAAYSLLGIFDIFMPLLYGEGREKAFARLYKEIDVSTQPYKNSGESVQQSSPTKSSPSSTVPFRRDDDFVPRDSLDKIHRICIRPASRAALVGLGGVGKSQIAIEYSYQIRDKSPNTWVFWVHAGSQARFEEGYRRIAEATKMDGWDDPKQNILRLVRSWLCNESNGRWLMVVDNADDASVFFQNSPQSHAAGSSSDQPPAELLSDFLPQSPNGSILITSRTRDVAHKLVGSYSSVIEVKPMDKDDALALLGKKIGLVANEDDAIALIHALDSMPLALTQAAAFIRQRAPRMTISRYLEDVRRSDHAQARLLKKDVGDSRRDGQASNSIIATWQISFEHIRKQMPTAARLLSLMSMFDRQGIPESLLRNRYAGNDDEEDDFDDDEDTDFDDDIHTLASFSLVEMSADGCEFEMHRLVQFSTRKWLELNNELDLWQATFAILMNESYPVPEYENWTACQALSPHAQAMLSNQPKDAQALEAWASVVYNASWYAQEMGQYDKAYDMGSRAVQVRDILLGEEHPDTLTVLDHLGAIMTLQGRFDKAEEMLDRAIGARTRVLGAYHPGTLNSMSNLATTYSNQGRWADAEALEVQVLEIRKTKLGADHPNTLASMSNLATTYSYQGRWADAEALGVQVLEIRKIKLGVDHFDTLASMTHLATTYLHQGRRADAEALVVQVLEIMKTMLGANHPGTLDVMSDLAYTLRGQGFISRAISLMEDCWGRRTVVLGPQHLDTVSSRETLTKWQQELKQLGEQADS